MFTKLIITIIIIIITVIIFIIIVIIIMLLMLPSFKQCLGYLQQFRIKEKLFFWFFIILEANFFKRFYAPFYHIRIAPEFKQSLLTAHKMKFSIKDFFSKCAQIRSYICWRNPLWETSFFVQCFIAILRDVFWTLPDIFIENFCQNSLQKIKRLSVKIVFIIVV